MIRLQLLSYELRAPQLRPLAIFFFARARVELPELANPETPRPEIAILLLPFACFLITVGKKSRHGFGISVFWFTTHDWFPRLRGTVDFLLHECDRLLRSSFAFRGERVSRRAFCVRHFRENFDRWRLFDAIRAFFDCSNKLFLRGDRVRREHKG